MTDRKDLITLELDKVLQMLQNRCVSDAAKQQAAQLTPCSDLAGVQTLIKNTEDAYILTARFGSPSFADLQEVDNALSRADAGGMLSMKELLQIGGVLRCIRLLLDWYHRCAGLQTSLDQRFCALVPNSYLEDKIFTSIVSEEALSDHASPDLFAIRRSIVNAENKVRDRLDHIVHSGAYQKYLQDAVITIRNGRFVVPVKAEHRGDVPGLVHDTSSTGSTVFVEPMAVVEANNEIKVLKAKETAEIERILFLLSGEAAQFADAIRRSCTVAQELDLIFGKAKLAFDMRASVPALNDQGVIDLKKARHPLLDPTKVVPVDIRLGGAYRVLVITGPNTGGKTVTLKAAGLLCLMAMCGLLIPAADHSCVSVFDRVLADIGDEQSIEQSLSTFSSHITNIIHILKQSDRRSLVLLDELCSGTDPIEGAALATAILEQLKATGGVIAATTHYAELKAYALDTPGVENGSCEFDVETLAPTYKLLIGVPGRSNAFAISQKLGMDPVIISHAQKLVHAEDSRFERVLSGLEATRKEYEQQQEQAQQMTKQAEENMRQAQQAADRLQRDYNRQMEQAKAQARMLIDDAKERVNRILDEMEQLKKDRSSDLSKMRAAARSSFKKLDHLEDGSKQPDSPYKLPRPLQIGDSVQIFDIGRQATVLALPDAAGNVQVQAGMMKMKVPLQNLRLVEHAKQAPPKTRHSLQGAGENGKASKRATLEIDVRGQNVEEATLELDRFIDSAMMNNIHSFTIIHGKGTGALRAGIHRYLKNNKFVSSFRLGVFGEGEDGVTVAELK